MQSISAYPTLRVIQLGQPLENPDKPKLIVQKRVVQGFHDLSVESVRLEWVLSVFNLSLLFSGK